MTMLRRPLGICITILLLTFSSAAIRAQEARKALLITEQAPENQFSGEQWHVLRESLMLSLQEQLESISFVLPLSHSNESAFEAAILNGADILLEARVSGSMDEVQIQFQLWDVVKRRSMVTFELDGAIDPLYRNLFGGFWYPVVQALRDNLPTMANSAELTIQARPGSRIMLIGGGSGQSTTQVHETDTRGNVVLTLPSPASYRIRVELQGYFREEEMFFLEQDMLLDIAAQQQKSSRWFIQPRLEMLSFPGVHGGLLLSRARFGIFFGATSYIAGLQPFNDQDLVTGVPLTTLEAGVSATTSFPETPLNIQAHGSLRVGMRLLNLEGVTIDSLWPVELRPEIGAALPITRRISLIPATAMVFFIPADPDFASQLNTSGSNSTQISEGLFLLKHPSLSLSVRIGW